MAVSSEHPAGSDCGHIEVLEDRHGATALRRAGTYWRTSYPDTERAGKSKAAGHILSVARSVFTSSVLLLTCSRTQVQGWYHLPLGWILSPINI